MNFFNHVSSMPWAISPDVAPELAAIADRAHQTDPKVLEAYQAFQLARTERARERDGVAILDVQGPLFKKANLFVKISGATSYEILRRDLQAALDNDAVKSILLLVDSPGGEANGCDELATAIFEARGVKPITAYVSGMAASGGYWIAAAADRIIVSDAAMLGSIGVVLGVRPKGPDDKTIEFVSSQSPGKRPDVGTDTGKGQIQAMVDDLAEVFVAAVAKYRGVSVEDVVANFGAGGMKIGAKAVAAGMADEVGQLEATITSMQASQADALSRVRALVTAPALTIEATAPTDMAARIKTIITAPQAKAWPSLSARLAFDTDLPAKACLAIMSAAGADFTRIAAAALKAGPKAPKMDGSRRYLQEQIRAGALGLEGATITEFYPATAAN